MSFILEPTKDQPLALWTMIAIVFFIIAKLAFVESVASLLEACCLEGTITCVCSDSTNGGFQPLLLRQLFGHLHPSTLISFLLINLFTLCQQLFNTLVNLFELVVIPFFAVLMLFAGIGSYFSTVYK